MSKKEIDVVYKDPSTDEIICTFNGCLDKFIVQGYEMVKGSHEYYYRACSECGRREITASSKL